MNIVMDRPFDSDLTEIEVVELLSSKDFRKIGEGHSAHVFAATDKSLVLKIFPPLTVGHLEDVTFISNNSILRYIHTMINKWQKFRTVAWIKQQAKLLVALRFSSRNPKKSENSSNLSIKGYEICISKGLMRQLPTRVIQNCVFRLSLDTSRTLRNYFEKPDKIVIQKLFRDNDLLINVLIHGASKGNMKLCKELIKRAIYYQVNLWNFGVADTDMSFNVFENLIVLPDSTLQIHDANDIVNSFLQARWFIREKEKDLEQIFRTMHDRGYPQLSSLKSRMGVSETAQKLYEVLPSQYRESLILLFLNRSREVLSEEMLTKNWNKAMMSKG